MAAEATAMHSRQLAPGNASSTFGSGVMATATGDLSSEVGASAMGCGGLTTQPTTWDFLRVKEKVVF